MMGSVLGSTLANLFMAELEDEWQKYTNVPIIYLRYVDDLYCAFENELQIDDFFNFLNEQHSNLRFTLEKGGSSIPFLDVKVTQSDKLTTEVYRKPTYTGLLLHYKEICPKNWKTNLVVGMLNRAFSICSNWQLFHKEIKNIKAILIKNGYPEDWIDDRIKSFIDSKLINTNNTDRNQTTDKIEIFTKIPYYGPESRKFAGKVENILNKDDNDIRVKAVFHTTKLKNFFSLKDKIPHTLKSTIVYKFQCQEDPGTKYLGKTKRRLDQRMDEHYKGHSAINIHIKDCISCRSKSNYNNNFKIHTRKKESRMLQFLCISPNFRRHRLLQGEGSIQAGG